MTDLIKDKKQLEKERIDYAEFMIVEAGYDVLTKTDLELTFNYKDSLIKFFPYTGWATGKTIKDGRGLKNLLKQLK